MQLSAYITRFMIIRLSHLLFNMCFYEYFYIMKNRRTVITHLLLLITASFSTNNMASIVRMEFMFGSNPAGEVYIELFDQDTPVTTSNFLNYIENTTGERRYDGTFIHRVLTGFVIQGGGYKYDPSLGAFSTTSALHIDTNAPIINEFDISRSNIRGTVAMAKLGGNPDSATSEWFFNLSDNSVNLDNQNGGFTVFGKVLGTGMDVVDTLTALDNINAGSPFTNLPVADFDSAQPIAENNLITIKPTIFLTDYPIDFGLHKPSTTSQTRSITIRNSDTGNLLLGNIDLSSVESPFSVIDNCSGQALLPSTSCSIDFTFNPTTIGNFSTNIVIPVNSIATPVTTSVSGSGGNPLPTLEIISPATPIDFGNITQTAETEKTLSLRNSGLGELQVESLTIAGVDQTAFISTNNTCTQALLLADTCAITLKFSAPNLGDKSATLTINTIPVDQTTEVTLTGSVFLPANLVLEATDPIEMGDTAINQATTKTVSINNSGDDGLMITGYNFSGDDASQFSISENCLPVIQPNTPCSETITFSATATGDYSSILEISSNDPDSPITTISVIATVFPSTANLVIEATDPIEMGDIAINQATTKTVSINNSGDDDLIITGYNFSGGDASQFSISESCFPVIQPNTPCSETITFSATAAGDYSSILEISSNDPDSPVTSITITATATPSFSNIVLGVDSPLEMTDTGINIVSTISLPLKNDGIGDLLISSYNFTGTNSDNFSISAVCLPRILPDTACTETISFSTTTAGDYASILEISSNDPDTPISTISISVNVSEDNDGIRDAIEQAAPNGGDNNQDGVSDAQQAHIASFPDINGRYISLVTDQSLLLTNVKAINNPSPTGLLPRDPNSTITFPYGFFEFTLENIPQGGSATVTIHLPADDQLSEFATYYKYNPASFSPPSSFIPEAWFPFDRRNNAATRIGAEFSSNTVTLHFIDGAFGDSDDEENGTIVDPGGIAFITPTIGSSTTQSSGGCTVQGSDAKIIKHLEWLIILCGLLMYQRLMRKVSL